MHNSNHTVEKSRHWFFNNDFWLFGLPAILMLASPFLYQSWWMPRQECTDKVIYHPAGTDRGLIRGGSADNNEAYYSISGVKFKYKSEAIGYCMRKR